MQLQTFWGHLEALRATLLRSLCLILCGFCITFFFCNELITFLTSPLKKSDNVQVYEIKSHRIENDSSESRKYTLPPQSVIVAHQDVLPVTPDTFHIGSGGFLIFEQKISSPSLILLGPVEGMVVGLKISLLAGLVLTSPLWLALLMNFLFPALSQRMKTFSKIFIFLSFLFISLGIAFAFFVTIPLANRYLLDFNGTIGTNMWSLSHYLNYTLFLLAANAFAFEGALILLSLVHLGIISHDILRNKRRHMILLAFILGALLTPPDVLTQFMLAIPLIVLYEFTILYARFHLLFRKDLIRY